MELISKQLADLYSQLEMKDQEILTELFLQFANEKNDQKSFLALEDGVGIFPTGERLDISGRNYFKIAIGGTKNISERIVSRQNGDDIFVISVPLLQMKLKAGVRGCSCK